VADPGAPFPAALPGAPYAELARRDPGKLRIGYSTRSPIGTEVDAEAVTAVEAAAKLLAGLGHEVEPAEPDLDGVQLADDFLTMWCCEAAATIDHIRELTGAPSREFESDTRLLAAAARSVSAPEYLAIHHRWNTYTRSLAAFHADYDLYLTPGLAEPPVRIGELTTPKPLRLVGEVLMSLRLAGPLSRTKIWKDQLIANLRTVPFTQLANITGRPAMAVPLHRTAQGLPLGVQFVGGLGAEPVLLALASQLEAERPWAGEEPPL
ncbi:amidase family protein, partial [Actinocorallia lasiicapitis]